MIPWSSTQHMQWIAPLVDHLKLNFYYSSVFDKTGYGGVLINTVAKEILSSAGPLQGCQSKEAELTQLVWS